MNQDQVKNILLKIQDTKLDFSLIFTGKKSSRVNGLYKPDTCEILIHNKNFKTDNDLIYTAIHEYTHHLVHESEDKNAVALKSSRVHTRAFWAKFHILLEKAENLGFYKIPIDTSPELAEITNKIKEKYLSENGRLMSELGSLLLKAKDLCKSLNIRYEDYLDRVICLPRSEAKNAMIVSSLNINPKIGYENMKIVSRLKDPNIRKNAENDFLTSKSPAMVQTKHSVVVEEDDLKTKLTKEKKRIENTISRLQGKLEIIENSLSKF